MIIFGSCFIFMVYVMGMTAITISEEEKDAFFKNVLHEQNQIRMKHSIDILIWNTDMAVEANNILKMFIPNKPLPFHPNYGINTYAVDIKDDFKLDAQAIVNSWYEQYIYYNYDDPNPSETTDKFTQLVWSSSKFISLAMSLNEKQFKFLALYYPRGNNKDEYKTNVNRPVFNEMPFNPLNK